MAQKIFKEMDKNNSGTISVEEIKEWGKKNNVNFKESELADLMSADKNSDGVSIEELEAWWEAL